MATVFASSVYALQQRRMRGMSIRRTREDENNNDDQDDWDFPRVRGDIAVLLPFLVIVIAISKLSRHHRAF